MNLVKRTELIKFKFDELKKGGTFLILEKNKYFQLVPDKKYFKIISDIIPYSRHYNTSYLATVENLDNNKIISDSEIINKNGDAYFYGKQMYKIPRAIAEFETPLEAHARYTYEPESNNYGSIPHAINLGGKKKRKTRKHKNKLRHKKSRRKRKTDRKNK